VRGYVDAEIHGFCRGLSTTARLFKSAGATSEIAGGRKKRSPVARFGQYVFSSTARQNALSQDPTEYRSK